jgi:hypothetical protein
MRDLMLARPFALKKVAPKGPKGVTDLEAAD